MKKEKLERIEKLTFGLLIAALVIVAFNLVQINNLMTPTTSSSSGSLTGAVLGVIPTGIPDVYGAELGISFDDVSPSDPQLADATIRKLAMIDVKTNLTGSNLERYIEITNQISCEYCCGAKAITFSNGDAACGCAHSYAMRGLAKYLITEHGDEYTNDEVLEELGKWKTLFFPTQMTSKAGALKENGIEFNYINLASNKYRGIEKGTSGGMVGGC